MKKLKLLLIFVLQCIALHAQNNDSGQKKYADIAYRQTVNFPDSYPERFLTFLLLLSNDGEYQIISVHRGSGLTISSGETYGSYVVSADSIIFTDGRLGWEMIGKCSGTTLTLHHNYDLFVSLNGLVLERQEIDKDDIDMVMYPIKYFWPNIFDDGTVSKGNVSD